MRKLIKLGLVASLFGGAGVAAAQAQEVAHAGNAKVGAINAADRPPLPGDANDQRLRNPPEDENWRNRYIGSIGAPPDCRGVGPASIEETSGAGWTDIRASILQCSAGLGGNAEPYLRRRMIYSGVSTTGALGAAIGGARAAATTTNAWVGLALLPIIFEGTFDRPEFDQVSGVTAYNLNWIVSRGDDLNRQQLALGSRVALMEGHERDLEHSIEGLAAGSEARDRQADEALLAAFQNRFEPNESEGEGAPAAEGAADDADTRLIVQLRQRLERTGRRGRTEQAVNDDVAREAMDDLITDLVRLRSQAGRIRDAASAQQSYIKQDLPSWGYEKFTEVMSVYGESRREMTLRPESAFRSVIALPLSTMATLIRGGRQLSENELYAERTNNNMRRINPAIGLVTASLTPPDEVRADLSNFHAEDRLYVQRALDTARELRQEAAATIELVNAGARLDAVTMDAVNAPSTSSAPAPTEPPAPPTAPTESTPAVPDAPSEESKTPS